MSLSIELIGVLAVVVVIWAVWLFRKRHKKNYYGQTLETAQASKPVSAPLKDDENAPYILTKPKRLSGIAFLGVWLFGWTFGVYFAIKEWLTLSHGDEGYIFLAIWLAFGIPAWFFVAWTLFRLLRGDHVEFEFDGDGDGGGGD